VSVFRAKVAQSPPDTLPKWSENPEKSEPKIDGKIDADFDRFGMRFLMIFGAKTKRKWEKNW
jgi:hypothetical protein